MMGLLQKHGFLLVLAVLFSPKLFCIGLLIAFGYYLKGEVVLVAPRPVLPKPSVPSPSEPVPLPHKIDTELDQLLSLIVRDFISFWFQPLNHSGQPFFQESVKDNLQIAIVSLGSHIKRTHPSSLTIPVFQVLKTHLKEYRRFEQSNLSLQDYCQAYPDSPFVKTEHYHQLDQFACIIIAKCFPSHEASSSLVVSLLREILASTVLLSVLDALVDPDFLNLQLIELSKRLKSNLLPTTQTSERRPRIKSKKKKNHHEQLFVKIIQANHLLTSGLNDLYCVLVCDTDVKKTQKVNAESNPIWLEEFTMTLDKSGMNGLTIYLYSTNFIQDDLVGTLCISKSEFIANKYTKKTVLVDTSDSKFQQEQSVEFQLEYMFISTNAMDTTEDTNSSRPSMEMILSNSESLMEFMQYMDDVGATALVQLYVMIESFTQFANLGNATDSLQSDAISVYNTFFSANAKHPLSPELLGIEVVQQTKQDIDQRVHVGVFKDLQKVVIETMESKYLKGFLDYDGIQFRPSETEEMIHDLSGPVLIESRDDSFSDVQLVNDSTQDFVSTGLDSNFMEVDYIAKADADVKQQIQQAQKEGGTQFLVATIASLREQIMVLDQKIEKTEGSKLKDLMEAKHNLQLQVSQLIDMVAEKQMSVPSQSLHYASVSVFDAYSENTETDLSVFSLNSKAFYKNLIFAISVEKNDRSAGWMITHSYLDFANLYERLADQFPKVQKMKIPLPVKGKLSGWSDAARRERQQLADELGRWINMLLTDAVLCEVHHLQVFLSPESDKPTQERRKKLSHPSIAGAFKSAGSVMKKVAVGASQVAVGAGQMAISAPIKVFKLVDTVATQMADGLQTILEEDLKVQNIVESRPVTPKPVHLSTPPISNVPSPKRVSTEASSISSKASFKTSEETEELNEADVHLMMECLFGIVEEIFNLSDPNQWMRQKGFYVVKNMARRAYGDLITEVLNEAIDNSKKEEAVAVYLSELRQLLWPDNVWFKNTDMKVRSEEEKEDAKLMAKRLFINGAIIPTDGISKIVGRYNTVVGLTRLFNMLQHRELNMILFMSILECLVTSIFL